MPARVKRVKNRIAESFRSAVELSSQPDHALIDIITVPRNLAASPWRQLGKRLMWAFALVVFVTFLVYFDREGYSEDLTWIDAAYYSSVSLTTVGYGDIVPVTQEARLVNLLVITPARLAFLVLLVGATLSVLTDRARRTFQISRWRRTLRNHTVVIGYGTKGAGAVAALLADG
ncbi:MAG: potassium channel family protein, partial [Corynebacterium casei]|nr:potassium channel family protein [Corynebacterium casei]